MILKLCTFPRRNCWHDAIIGSPVKEVKDFSCCANHRLIPHHHQPHVVACFLEKSVKYAAELAADVSTKATELQHHPQGRVTLPNRMIFWENSKRPSTPILLQFFFQETPEKKGFIKVQNLQCKQRLHRPHPPPPPQNQEQQRGCRCFQQSIRGKAAVVSLPDSTGPVQPLMI